MVFMRSSEVKWNHFRSSRIWVTQVMILYNLECISVSFSIFIIFRQRTNLIGRLINLGWASSPADNAYTSSNCSSMIKSNPWLFFRWLYLFAGSFRWQWEQVGRFYPSKGHSQMWCFEWEVLFRCSGRVRQFRIGSLTLWQWNLGHILNFHDFQVPLYFLLPGWPLFGFTLFRVRPFSVSIWLFDESQDLFVLFILFGGLFFRDEGALKMAQNKMKNCAKSTLAVGLLDDLSEAHVTMIRHFNLCQNVDGWSTRKLMRS